MKRSSAVHLVLLAAVALEGCGRQECVDEHNVVVDDRYCQGQLPAGGHGFRWYNGGVSGYVPVGSTLSASETARGVFGAAGDSAGGHGSGGEGAGAGE